MTTQTIAMLITLFLSSIPIAFLIVLQWFDLHDWLRNNVPPEARYAAWFCVTVLSPLVISLALLYSLWLVVFRFMVPMIKGFAFWFRFARNKVTGWPAKKPRSEAPKNSGVYR